jgi:hypothetical protein
MAKITSVVLGIVFLTLTASSCISVHKKEVDENPPTTIEHHTIVTP